MTPERSAKAKETFHSAIKLGQEERPEFLARACGPDIDLRLEVENLLREHTTQVVLLHSPLCQPDLTGRIITHYRILETLGQGGMGLVYKAEDVKLGRTVALKFLAPHVPVSEQHRTRIVHEAKALAAIDHPNSVRDRRGTGTGLLRHGLCRWSDAQRENRGGAARVR